MHWINLVSLKLGGLTLCLLMPCNRKNTGPMRSLSTLKAKPESDETSRLGFQFIENKGTENTWNYLIRAQSAKSRCRIVKVCAKPGISPCLQANKLACSFLWILAEDTTFLSQRQRTWLLTESSVQSFMFLCVGSPYLTNPLKVTQRVHDGYLGMQWAALKERNTDLRDSLFV